MSKRYPLSAASKLYNELAPKLEPYLSRADSTVDYGSRVTSDFIDRILEIYRQRNGVSCYDTSTLFQAAAKSSNQLLPDDLIWTSRWKTCRQVYKIDPTITDELATTDINDEIPCSIFAHLPYPIMYIDMATTVPLSDGTAMRCVGFFACTVNDSAHGQVLCLILLGDNGGRIPTSLPVSGKMPLREFVERNGALRLQDGQKVSDFELDEVTDARGLAEYVAAMRTIIGSLLFIISKENGAEVIYAPPKQQRNQKPGKRTNQETVTQVGAKLGRANGAHCCASHPPSALAIVLDRQAQGPH